MIYRHHRSSVHGLWTINMVVKQRQVSNINYRALFNIGHFLVRRRMKSRRRRLRERSKREQIFASTTNIKSNIGDQGLLLRLLRWPVLLPEALRSCPICFFWGRGLILLFVVDFSFGCYLHGCCRVLIRYRKRIRQARQSGIRRANSVRPTGYYWRSAMRIDAVKDLHPSAKRVATVSFFGHVKLPSRWNTVVSGWC